MAHRNWRFRPVLGCFGALELVAMLTTLAVIIGLVVVAVVGLIVWVGIGAKQAMNRNDN